MGCFLFWFGFFSDFCFFKFLWRQFHSSIVLIRGVFQFRPNSLALFCEAVRAVGPTAQVVVSAALNTLCQRGI